MAVNLEALRKKLAQLSGANSRKNLTWRPQAGEEKTIRLISFPDNDGQPFKELWFYYNIGNNPGLLSPNQFGKPDPIQELINKLRSDDTKESYELCKKLYPKMRSFIPVVVRGEEEKGVRLWSFGKMVYQELLKYMLDADYAPDITDPKEGFDIKVSCTQPPGKLYAETSVRPRPRSTPLSEDQDQVKEWLGAIPNLDDLYSLKSYEELERIINTWLADPEDTADNSSAGTSRGAAPAPAATPETPKKDSSTFQDLDDAFADLENI